MEPLLEKLGQPKGAFGDIKRAVEWLNTSIVPFQIYLKHIETNGIDKTIRELFPKDFKLFSENQLKILVLTADGQKLKRAILSQLYPQETPKSLFGSSRFQVGKTQRLPDAISSLET